MTVQGDRLTFAESYWRSKFYIPCDVSQSTDMEITPGTMTFRYQIYRQAGNNGSAHWVLQLINPNGSSFLYLLPALSSKPCSWRVQYTPPS